MTPPIESVREVGIVQSPLAMVAETERCKFAPFTLLLNYTSDCKQFLNRPEIRPGRAAESRLRARMCSEKGVNGSW